MAASARARILFVTRKFPPSVGGMETLAHSAWHSLLRTPAECRLIALGRSQGWLPLWLPIAALRVLVRVLRRPDTVVLCGDALLHAALSPILRLVGARHATMAMGLDLSWPVGPYQWLIRRTLPAAEQVLAISRSTAAVARAHGVAEDRVRVVRLAVPLPEVRAADRATARAALCDRHGISAANAVLVSVSRLVRRKGLRWFVAEVLPDVPGAVLLIAGEGPEREAIMRAASEAGLGDRCRLLGRVDDAAREGLLQGADLFVQPNVHVEGDIEGFGLVAVEAAGRGALVIAADLEGLQDAVVHERTGLLLPSGDAVEWQRTLTRLLASRRDLDDTARRFEQACRGYFDFEAMGRALLSALEGEPPEGA